MRAEVGDDDGVAPLLQLAVEPATHELGLPARAEDPHVRPGRRCGRRHGETVRLDGDGVAAAHQAHRHIGLVDLERLVRGRIDTGADLLELAVRHRWFDGLGCQGG